MRGLLLASIFALGVAGCASEEPATGMSYTVRLVTCECGVTNSFPEWTIPGSCYGCKRQFWSIYCPKCRTTMHTTSLGAMCLCGVDRAIAGCPTCGSTGTHVLKPGPYACDYRKHPFQIGWCRKCRIFRARPDGVAPVCTTCRQPLYAGKHPNERQLPPPSGPSEEDRRRHEALVKDARPAYDAARKELEEARDLLFGEDGRRVYDENLAPALAQFRSALARLEDLRQRHAAIAERAPIALVDPDHLQANVLQSMIRAHLVAKDRPAFFAAGERQVKECANRRAVIAVALARTPTAELASHWRLRDADFRRLEADAHLWLGMEEKLAGKLAATRAHWKAAIAVLPAGDPGRAKLEGLLGELDD